jgi:hypothetical protein
MLIKRPSNGWVGWFMPVKRLGGIMVQGQVLQKICEKPSHPMKVWHDGAHLSFQLSEKCRVLVQSGPGINMRPYLKKK